MVCILAKKHKMSSKYEQLEHLTDAQFRRHTGVKRSTFTLMVQTYKQALIASYKRPGRPCSLTAEDKILMMLEYNREHRTYFHVANSFAISEANAYKIIQTVENLAKKRYVLQTTP
jgi:DNA-binding Lrp family transcriptional regulator